MKNVHYYSFLCVATLILHGCGPNTLSDSEIVERCNKLIDVSTECYDAGYLGEEISIILKKTNDKYDGIFGPDTNEILRQGCSVSFNVGQTSKSSREPMMVRSDWEKKFKEKGVIDNCIKKKASLFKPEAENNTSEQVRK